MLENFPAGITEESWQLILIGGLIRFVVWLLFAFTVYNTLRLIKKDNQCILPKQAWFLAVPFFNIYWNFEVVKRLSDSLNNEFYDRQMEAEEQPTLRSGLLFAWTFLLTNIPLPMAILASLAILHLIYFVIYWVRIAQYKSLLKLHIAHYGVDYVAQEKENYEN